MIGADTMVDYMICGFRRQMDNSSLNCTGAGVVVACVYTGDGLDCRRVGV